MHAVKRRTTRAKAGSKVGRPTRTTPVGRVAVTGGTAALVGRMQDYHSDLLMRRESLDSEITAISNAIEAIGAAAPAASQGRRPGRPAGRVGRPRSSGGRKGSLRDYVLRTMGKRSTPMSPRQLASAVVKAGYKSKAKDLTKAVSNLLPQLKQVKRVGFGKYRL